MVTLSKDQIEAPRANRLLAVWRDRAARQGLDETRIDALADPVVQWLMTHRIEQPENVEFVMIAAARSNGAFLTAAPIQKAMQLSFGEDDLVVSAIRRETAAQARHTDS
ncbi:hypothetical protein [Roseobacter weihaiensis]|uniref:hypothetical protein n=1 Tax=Roseobacter weihaiensis TaxID=2763262 RepID=UPI001D09B9AA|nr:hypothetical protein [Roseobacter sp. H9]